MVQWYNGTFNVFSGLAKLFALFFLLFPFYFVLLQLNTDKYLSVCACATIWVK